MKVHCEQGTCKKLKHMTQVVEQQQQLLEHNFVPLTNILNANKTQFSVLTKLVTPKAKVQRPHVHVCALVDNSGSMAGEKLKNAKSAVRKMIKYLAPTDVLHYVVYSSNARVIFAKGDLEEKPALIAQVNATRTEGSTNISEGLNVATDVLLKHAGNSAGIIKRIFLFSDGQVNEGVVTSNGLFEIAKDCHSKGISVSSFGIGSDFNEEIMKGIAQHGMGDYFFIKDANIIPSYVSKSIQGLVSVFGTDCKVKVKPGTGITITSMGNKPNTCEYEVGELHADNTKQILVQMDVAANSDPSRLLFSYEVSYTDGEQKPVVFSGDVTITVDASATEQKENDEVFVATMLQLCAKEERNVLLLMDQNKLPEAILAKNALIKHVKSCLQRDVAGKLQKIVEKMEIAVADMDKNRETARKQLDYAAYNMECDDDYIGGSPVHSACSVDDIPDPDSVPLSPQQQLGFDDYDSGYDSA